MMQDVIKLFGLENSQLDKSQIFIYKSAQDIDNNQLSDLQFQLALSPNTLFLPDTELSIQNHLDTIRELARIAHEVRIMPITHNSEVSNLLGPVMLALQQQDYTVEVKQTEPGAMLIIRKNACEL